MPKLKCLLLTIAFAMNSVAFAVDAETAEQIMAQQREACNKNSAMRWDSALNRCVGKTEARQTRNESKECDKLTEESARKACHLRLATSKTGLSADPQKLGSEISDKQTQSTVVNSITAAASIVNIITTISKGGVQSNCTSKTILAVTSLGGFLTDLYIKAQVKKKLKDLESKFIVEKKDNAYNTQVKALEYLKKEQEVIKDIASQEKKRQMLLMVGYAVAGVMAAVDATRGWSCEDGETGPKEGADAASKTGERTFFQKIIPGGK